MERLAEAKVARERAIKEKKLKQLEQEQARWAIAPRREKRGCASRKNNNGRKDAVFSVLGQGHGRA